MTRRRLALLLAFAAALLIVLLAAPAAFASAGGGSAGFGGGGGGEGGGGGRGAGLYIVLQLLFHIALLGHGIGALVLIALFVLYILFTRYSPMARSAYENRENSGRAARRRVAQRERRVELAAAEAADEDPAFAPDVVRASAAKLFTDVQAAWDADDRARLRALVGPSLLAEWERRLDDFARRGWRNRVQPLEPPKVDYVSLRRRDNGDGGTVVVRIEARMRDIVVDHAGHHIKREGRFTETVRLREYWTLGRRNDRWILVSIEQGAEGAHALSDELIATSWADEGALRDEALVEGAVADAVPEGTSVAEVADLNFTGTAQAAALDLSLADGRFAPDVLEVAARRAVAAWAEAIDGPDDALLAIARPQAAREMLYPGDSTRRIRLVVRGPRVREIRVVGLDAAATPPTMTIEVDVAGRRYLEDRDTTAVVAGSPSREVRFVERWALALDGDAAQPWRIATVASPVGQS